METSANKTNMNIENWKAFVELAEAMFCELYLPNFNRKI